ncbi:MAG: TrkH family potassium uptake protein [Acetatifactor sp.]|nr:TrkH family potassium uptake protein [Acetatifactor sp.]
MNYKMMGKFMGKIIIVEAIFMIPSVLIGLWDRDFTAVGAFLATIGINLAIALLLHFFCKNSKDIFFAKEGMACVGLSWLLMALLGCLPFFFSGAIPNFVDAFFESASGFTTTGASIMPAVEGVSRAVLYWRSFTHWLGGMGVLVFLLAITSVGGRENGFTMHLLRAESPGPSVGKLVPKMRKTASILYLIYVALTVLDFIFLLFGRMDVFEAVCTALGTAGTGGFGVRNDSIAGYSSYIQNVCTVFMLVFGVNFSLYYLILIKQVKNVFKDEELRMYVLMVVGSIALIVWNLKGFYETFGETVKHAAFQVATIVSTTGFASTDFDQWPGFSKAILFFLMITGACAGSTAGGFKCGRALLLFKGMKRSVQQVVHPNKVQVVRLNNHAVDEKVLQGVNAYLAAYVVIFIVSFLLVSLDGFSLITNISAVSACFNNIGPGFEAVGPTCNFAGFGIFSKLILILDMIAGRLEIFPILVLFSGATWRHR